jgi:hypothetical protein
MFLEAAFQHTFSYLSCVTVHFIVLTSYIGIVGNNCLTFDMAPQKCAFGIAHIPLLLLLLQLLCQIKETRQLFGKGT